MSHCIGVIVLAATNRKEVRAVGDGVYICVFVFERSARATWKNRSV